MIPGISIFDFITWAGVLGVAVVIFAETGLLVGFLLPGDSLLITAGLLAHQGVLDININTLVIILFVAALIGNQTGYIFGKHVGRRLFKRHNSLIFHQQNLLKAEAFYEKYGNKAVVIACFVPFARTFVPILAGVGKMTHRTFTVFNTIGILVWSVGFTYLGYYAGAWLESKGIDVDHYLLIFIAVVVVLSALAPIIHIMRDKDLRQSVATSAKKTLKRRKR